MATTIDLQVLLKGFDDHVAQELESMPDVVEVGDDLDLGDLAVGDRIWAKVDEIVAVVADLKSSTLLGTGKKAPSTASIYEAAVDPLVSIFDEFGADDLAIQGDGAYAVFWGDLRYERAMAAGITIKTFSELHLEKRLEAKWPEDLPETGFKVGVAASTILVKRIGIARKDRNEEIWAGKAVNFAVKAAQSGDRRELIVPGNVWDVIEPNEYIAYSCDCGNGPSETIWSDVEIKGIPDNDDDRFGRKLTSRWCTNCGPKFCNAILAGETKRESVAAIRGAHGRRMAQHSLEAKQRRDQRNRRALQKLRSI